MARVPIPRKSAQEPPRSPEELYDSLTVTDPAIGALWRHQSHVLGRYYERYADDADVALELPTGSGKTLVGLLIADWRRRARNGASAFVCPTRQLARQAHEKATGYGIPSVLLIGPSRAWDAAEETRGSTGEATVVTVYSHIFNTSPKLSPKTLVLDDAHAAEGPVAENWSVSVDREHAAYKPLLECVESSLLPARFRELTDDELDPHSRPVPQLVGANDLSKKEDRLRSVLRECLDEDESARYAFSEVSSHLSGCLMYAGWQEILIRPFIPPTRFHPTFEDADQRVYLSATLGKAGELERSFGRTRIPRVETPPDWERRGSGRRLALLPRAGMPAAAATLFIKQTISEFERALVLVPSGRAMEAVRVLLPDDWLVLEKGDVDEMFHPFQESEEAALLLANRYDGIDLPGKQCELILISGLPVGTHLQERFISETVEARSALRERVRTRLMQGMGRATRSRNDHAVVLMAGEDLIDFLRDPENLAGMRPELQAELRYGLFLSQEGEDLSDLVRAFVERSDDWKQAEGYLREEADEADLDPPAGADQLQEAAPSEVLASQAAWRAEHDQACAFAQAVVRKLTVGSVAPYRTLWKVLAAQWAAEHASASGEPVDLRIAAQLCRDATASARTRTWRPRLPKIQPPKDLEGLDDRAVNIASAAQRIARSPRADRHIAEMLKWIGSNDSVDFERGLERLGEMLGFDSVRPNAEAAPDGAWRDGAVHILWEAKSEQKEDGEVSAELVRQANTHATWVVRELEWDDAVPATTFLVSHRRAADENAVAVAAEELYLCTVEVVRELAKEVAELWQSIVARTSGLSSVELAEQAAQELATRDMTTQQLKTRLNASRIAELVV
jgi:hypothetical protein